RQPLSARSSPSTCHAHATVWPWPMPRITTPTAPPCWSFSTSASSDRPPEAVATAPARWPERGNLWPVAGTNLCPQPTSRERRARSDHLESLDPNRTGSHHHQHPASERWL